MATSKFYCAFSPFAFPISIFLPSFPIKTPISSSAQRPFSDLPVQHCSLPLCNSSSSSCFMASSFKNNQRLDLPPHKPHLSAQRLPSDTQQNQSKFSSFLLKGAFIAIVIVVLPFYPSQAPEFINHTIFNRGWEFLRLGIIGVALSYGLLSRRRAETEKEIQAQIDSTQSYVSKILQVSPVFDNENDAAPYNDSGKVHVWSSLYSPSEPMVMVAAKEDDDHLYRPLSLPVRSLKSGQPDAEASASIHKVREVKGGHPVTVSANARSNGSIRNGKREIRVSDLSNLDGNAEGNVVLPSPVPWGSRSGRFEMEEGIGLRPPGVPPPSVSESELPASPSPIPWGSRPICSSNTSPTSSPSYSVSPTRGPASVQKAAINPTPTFVSANIDGVSAAANECVNQDKNLHRNMKHSESFDGSLVGKSVRRVRKSESLNSRSGESIGLAGLPDESRERRSRRSSEPSKDENSARKNRDGEYVMAGKPERQNRGTKNEPEETLSRKSRGTYSTVAGKTEKKNREVEVVMVEKTQRKSILEPPPPPPVEEFVKYQRIWKKEKIDALKAQTEESTEIDEDDDEEEEEEQEQEQEQEQELERKNDIHTQTVIEAVESKPVVETEIDANEVDKKADEFIAKFREQIRLQRIESIKRASAQKKKTKPTSAT